MLNQPWESFSVSGHTQTLPAIPAAQLASNTEIIAHMRNGAARPARVADNDHGRIFVVDAYPDLAAFAAGLLEQGGFRARAFDNAMTAWHAFVFANPKPDVLIVHDSQGEVPGLELIRLCKEMNPGLKALLITSRRRFQMTRSERSLVDELLPPAYCGPLLVAHVGKVLHPENWEWRKAQSFLGLLFPKYQKAFA